MKKRNRKVYTDYENNKWEYDETVQLILGAHPRSVLEVGCGEGHFIEKISGLVGHAAGLEINEKAVAICRSKGLNVSSTDLLQISECFDMIVLFQVLEHLAMPERVIEKLISLLNPGGLLVIAVPNPEGYFKNAGIVLLDMPPHHNSAWSMKTFNFMAQRYKLRLVRESREPLRFVHYIGYLTNLLDDYYSLEPKTFMNRVLHKIRRKLVPFIAPYFYQFASKDLIGQTHLVAFEKQ
jgi:2-polyprenyl-3-methyl-5-hydroxy-6-metoxy-1,4-benzoquinol methylase